MMMMTKMACDDCGDYDYNDGKCHDDDHHDNDDQNYDYDHDNDHDDSHSVMILPDRTSIYHVEYGSFINHTDERGIDLDCTDVFFKTARISVPPPHKVHIKSEFMQSQCTCFRSGKCVLLQVSGGLKKCKYWVASSNRRVIC